MGVRGVEGRACPGRLIGCLGQSIREAIDPIDLYGNRPIEHSGLFGLLAGQAVSYGYCCYPQVGVLLQSATILSRTEAPASESTTRAVLKPRSI